jgi:hypothetical protein
MAVLLLKSYGANVAGTTVEFTAELEAALIAQGLASSALATTITTGAQTTAAYQGTVAVAAASGASIVVTNALVTPNTKIWACVSQAAADGTWLRVERIVPAAGSFTIYGTAAATATTYVDWAILQNPGLTPAA